MGLLELFFIGTGLSMDAFAVSICTGFGFEKYSIKHSIITGLWFGLFQAVMPLLGYLIGIQFSSYIEAFDHWVAFILLLLIGLNMIRESIKKEPEDCEAESSLTFKKMLPLAVATSIDALAIGVSFAFLNVNIAVAVILIGCITFVVSAFGVKIGNIFGSRYKSRAELAGGIVLILIGIKILLEHIGII